MDQDQHWLLSCLNTTLDPNQETRSFAEASLQPGHSPPSSPRNIFQALESRIIKSCCKYEIEFIAHY